jgi:hypothetical protein
VVVDVLLNCVLLSEWACGICVAAAKNYPARMLSRAMNPFTPAILEQVDGLPQRNPLSLLSHLFLPLCGRIEFSFVTFGLPVSCQSNREAENKIIVIYDSDERKAIVRPNHKFRCLSG